MLTYFYVFSDQFKHESKKKRQTWMDNFIGTLSEIYIQNYKALVINTFVIIA